MALAKLTCGSCGGALTLRDTICPACKAPVELPRGEASPGAVVCQVCGHIAEGQAPDECPICGVGREYFRAVANI